MATIRSLRIKKQSNKIPLNFVVRSRSRSRLTVQKEVITVETSNDRAAVSTTDREPGTIPDLGADTDPFDGVDDSVETTTHTKRKLKLNEKWEALRCRATRVAAEGFSLPSGHVCCQCSTEPAKVRCLKCGPSVYFCGGCGVTVHQGSLFHHYPEILKVII